VSALVRVLLRRGIAMNTSSQQPFATQLFEHQPSLRRRAMTLCSRSADADDLVQETFVRAITHEQQFEPGTNLRAWLMRILYHAFVSRHRHTRRERAALERFAAELSRDEPKYQVECATELPDRIKRALGVLPDPMAEVVKLVDIDEFSYREVAESLNVPVGTVMSRLFRGRQRLALELTVSSHAMPPKCAAAA
jgi:RNA polymerase sigma-70 factor, ECF subfamily